MFAHAKGAKGASRRDAKDVRTWSTQELHNLAKTWKGKKDAGAQDLTYDAWEIEPDWEGGIGPRDVMRAGWEKDVGDVEYIIAAYKDPSKEAFGWWYATVCGKIAAHMKQQMQGSV